MSPAHPLDRPVWSALTSRQSHLAVGDGRALRFDADYALFAAAADDADDSVAALARLLPAGGAMGLVEAGDVRLPDGLTARSSACVQMTLSALTPGGPEPAFEPLGEADAAQMLALATLTEPGPFFSRTHRLGDFIGVRQGGRLVAMAGERMKPDGFTEVSGVCTHPDWRGRGYAAGLMRIVAARILARGETPFLHAYAQNGPAIQLHQSLGFAVRTAIAFTVLTAAPSQGPYGHG